MKVLKLAQSPRCRSPRGIALVAVLWIIAILTMVLTLVLMVVRVDAEALTSESHSFRAWQLASTGLSYAAHPSIERDDPLLEWASEDADESYQVEIAHEASRININYVLKNEDKSLLKTLFRYWLDDDEEAAAELTDALVDWVDADDLTSLVGAEKDWYEGEGYTGRPFNRYFQSLDELLMVKGFDAVVNRVPDWREWFTLLSEGAIDIHEADPELLHVVAEAYRENAEQFVFDIAGEDEKVGTSDDVRYTTVAGALDALGSEPLNRGGILPRFTLKGNVLRIQSTGKSGFYGFQIESVIRKARNKPKIMRYKEKRLDQ